MSVEPALDSTNLAHARASIPEHVVLRAFPTETVLLNLETARYHGLNPVAGRMLEELERQETVAAAAKVVAEEYGQDLQEVEHDVCVLCQDLAGRGLVSLDFGAKR